MTTLELVQGVIDVAFNIVLVVVCAATLFRGKR
jgi:hypothetical protein